MGCDGYEALLLVQDGIGNLPSLLSQGRQPEEFGAHGLGGGLVPMVDAQHVLIPIRHRDAEGGIPAMRQEPESCAMHGIGSERCSRQTGQVAYLRAMVEEIKRLLHSSIS
jgi:hypothetical protein